MCRILISLLLFCLACALTHTVSAQQPNVAADRDARISLNGIDGKKYDTSKMKGSYLLVAFGATWCQPCHEELRDLEILHLEFKDRPIKFMWITVEDKEEASDDFLRRFAKSLKFTFPVLRDPGKRAYKQFSERTRLPLVVIFDREGKVVMPNQFGASSQPGVFRINMRNRLKQLFSSDETSRTTGAY